MEIAIIQKEDEIAIELFKLMKQNKTNLTKLCKQLDLDYQKYYRAIYDDLIRPEFLRALCLLINSNITVDFVLNNVSLKLEVIFNTND